MKVWAAPNTHQNVLICNETQEAGIEGASKYARRKGVGVSVTNGCLRSSPKFQSNCEHTLPAAPCCSMFSGNTLWNRVKTAQRLGVSSCSCSSHCGQGLCRVGVGRTEQVRERGEVGRVGIDRLALGLCRAHFCCFHFYFTKQKTNRRTFLLGPGQKLHQQPH